MGRKKIEIKFIENKKERAVTFCKRKHGLLKKAAELATLCGVKVCLLFTDLIDSMHYFSNDPDMRVEFDGLRKRKEGAFIYTYSMDDYPFTSILDSQKRDIRGELDSKAELDTKAELLSKRRPITEILLPEGIGIVGGLNLPFPDKASAVAAGFSGQPIVVKSEAGVAPTAQDPPPKKLSFGLPNTLCVPMDKRVMDQEDSFSQNSTAHFKNLDSDQAKTVEVFLEEMGTLVKDISGQNNRDPKRDEDLIVLLTLKRFVLRYFSTHGEGPLGSDAISRLMRSKVAINEMILVLNSIKFRDKNSDMILVTVKQFADIFLELLVSPQSFKPSQINFYRGGKSIVNLFIFLLKNFFQQARLMKSISTEEGVQQPEVTFLFGAEPAVDLLTGLIDAAMELCVLENTQGPIPNNTSAFQLHSQRHSQEHVPVHHQTHESEGQMASINFLDRNIFGTSHMGRCKSKGEKYSFELGRDLLGSGRLSPVKEDHKDTHADPVASNGGGNMNNFVSNLLRKPAKPLERHYLDSHFKK